VRLVKDGATVWRETVLEVSTRISLVDAFYHPVDRRARATAVIGDAVVRALDIRAITQRAHEFEAGIGWDAAQARAERWIADARVDLAGTGHVVDPVPAFELDAEGRPTRCLVRLEQLALDAPTGWTNRVEQPGAATVLDGLAALDRSALAALRAALPAGEREGVAYCRIVRHDGATEVQVYLPAESIH